MRALRPRHVTAKQERMTMSPIDKGGVSNTDQEIMAAAWDDAEPDFDDTDRSLEEMGDGPEGQIEPEDEEAEAAAAPEGEEVPEKPAETAKAGEPEKEPEPEPEYFKGLPLNARNALISERKARRAAEEAFRAADERY